MEAASKNRRGRPRIHDRELIDKFSDYDILNTRAKTLRGKQAAYLAHRACACLLNPGGGGFVDGVEQIVKNESRGLFRTGVLEQLGRIKVELDVPDSQIVELARRVSADFRDDPAMTVRHAVKFLRVMRGVWRKGVKTKS